jgi:hypothetical protein
VPRSYLRQFFDRQGVSVWQSRRRSGGTTPESASAINNEYRSAYQHANNACDFVLHFQWLSKEACDKSDRSPANQQNANEREWS